MMNISTYDRVHFRIYILNHNSLTHQTWSIDRCKQAKYFSETFWTILRTGAKFQALFNLPTYFNYSITNCVKILVFHFFGKLNKGQLKMINVSNFQISLYCHFKKVIKGPGTSSQSPALDQKYVRNVCHTTH